MKDDIYQNKRSKLGKSMYTFTNNLAQKLSNHKWLYYFLNYSWGSITTFLGLLLTLILLICGRKPIKYHGIYYFKIFKNRGGMTMGSMFIRNTTSIDSINKHEFGHTWQNAIYGPFFIFLIGMPSVIRYWYRMIRNKKGKTNKAYDLIWFEGSATTIGRYIVDE